MTFIKFVLGLIFGPIVKIFTGYMDHKTQTAIIKGEVAKESIRANVELSLIKKEMHQINMGWWATRWIVPLIAYPIIAWWILVFVDTIFQIPNWDVAAPPEPIYSWTGEIILSFFIIRGGEMVANTVTAWSAAGTIANVVGRVFSRREK